MNLFKVNKIFLVFAILIALLLSPVAGQYVSASSSSVNTEAYEAYYDILTQEYEKYGVLNNSFFQENMFKQVYDIPKEDGLIFARIIDFDNNSKPELLYVKYYNKNENYTTMTPVYEITAYVYGYQSGYLVKLAEENLYQYPRNHNVVSGPKISAWMGLAKDKNNKSYLVTQFQDPHLEENFVYSSLVDGVFTKVSSLNYVYRKSTVYNALELVFTEGNKGFFIDGKSVSSNTINAKKNALGASSFEEFSPNNFDGGIVLSVLKDLESKISQNYRDRYRTPSTWAADVVNKAIADRNIPNALKTKYASPITRDEFCQLAMTFYENETKIKIAARQEFNDTKSEHIQKMAGLGVVSGTGNGNFNPYDRLTREQAAVILCNLADVLGIKLTDSEPKFSDLADISSWAVSKVGKVQAAGIMRGTSENTFSPKMPYTREQSVVTLANLFSRATRVEGISFAKPEVKLKIGESIKILPTILPANSSINTFNWKSANDQIATVDSNGNVKAVSIGTVSIEATVMGDKKATYNVIVSDENDFSISLPKLPLSLVAAPVDASKNPSKTEKPAISIVEANISLTKKASGDMFEYVLAFVVENVNKFELIEKTIVCELLDSNGKVIYKEDTYYHPRYELPYTVYNKNSSRHFFYIKKSASDYGETLKGYSVRFSLKKP